jgi:hypothetical protein
MIFKPEMVAQIQAGKKTVTRRPVKYVKQPHPYVSYPLPCHYEVGKDYAIQPGRGQKAVGRIHILAIDQRPLYVGNPAEAGEEARAEGFNRWGEFRAYWIKLYGRFDSTQLVHRIEFELVPSEEALK